MDKSRSPSPSADAHPPLTSAAIPSVEPTLNEGPTEDTTATPETTGGFDFWMIFISLMVSMFLSAIDLTSVSTALPTIVKELNGDEFVWVGSAFALASTAVLPLTGGLAQIFGRRPVVLGALTFFGVGSGICGGATNMNMLIAGRAVQGVGGGGILSMAEIIVADLVPLAQRGTYMGILGSVWAIASAIGPPLGGAFSQSNWRWLFYMNIPLTAIAMVLVFFFLKLKFPQDDFWTKMGRMDWIGNVIIIIATTITVVALTWAGIKYSWASYQVLVPLILGLVATAGFFWYEAKFAKEPVVPWNLMNNRTGFFGYVTVFLHGLVSMTIVYYLPVYFQGALMQGPVQSGVSLFGNAFTIAPGAMLCGVLVAKLNFYKPQNYIGWALTTIGIGLLTLLKYDTPKGQWVGFQIVEGIGLGFLYAAPTFPVLAPLPITQTAHALALFTFVRSYAQLWGVQVGATILQNQLTKNLPADFLAQLGGAAGGELAFAIIPSISTLPEPMRSLVREAFAKSVRVIWLVMVGFSGLGFLMVFGMKEIPMHTVTDEDWGMAEKRVKEKDEEKNAA